MPSKEHLALKFDICTILQSAKPDETARTADLILSTILAALLEPNEAMKEASTEADSMERIWRAMLAASPLGEQSE